MPSRFLISNHSIRVDGDDIAYEVRRSARRKKTVQLSIRGRDVVVNAPAAMTDVDIREFVRSRADWIAKTLSERKEAAPEEPFRFVTGETLPYLGRPAKLVVRSSDDGKLRVHFDRRRFHVSIPEDLPKLLYPPLVGGEIGYWYADRAQERLPRDIDRWWPKLGRGDRSKIRVSIGNARSRWGSCSSDGKIRFSWRVMMLEPALIDYIVVHELAHLSVMNHSSQFWAVVEAAMPDWKTRRATLREAGRALPF